MATILAKKIGAHSQVIPVIAPVARALMSGVYCLLTDTIAQNDTATAVFDVPAQTLVCEIKIRVSTAFDGTDPALIVGDGDDTDGWFAAAEIGILAATAGFKSSLKGGQPYAGGKLYATADTIDVAITAGSGTLGRFSLACFFRPFADRNEFASP